MKIFLNAFALIALTSCYDKINEYQSLSIQDNFVAKEKELRGTVCLEDSVTGPLWFHDCYCKKTKDRLEIYHVYLRGIENDQLFTYISGDSVEFILQAFGPQVRPDDYSFKDRKIILNSQNQSIGQTLQGSIHLSGTGLDYEGDSINFDLTGDFECVIKDSTYSYSNFMSDIEKKYGSKKQ